MHDLPDLRDGLEPVERSIVKALAEATGARRRRTIRSSELLERVLEGPAPSLEHVLVEGTGPQQPSDALHLATYLVLVRLAQPFRTRYPLVDGIGNLGSIDGDPPADAAFTSCRLSRFGEAVAAGLAPHLLVNGGPRLSDELAVSFLPHRLGDVLAAASALIRDPGLSDEALAAIVPGPDFPTGGMLPSLPLVGEIDRRGEGVVRVRGRAERATVGSCSALVVTEIPFLVPKSRLVEEASQGLRSGALPGITDVRDESDAHGIRLVFPLRAGVAPEHALAELFGRTSLEVSLRVDMRAVVDGTAQRVSLATVLRAYVRQLRERAARSGAREADPGRLLAELEALSAAHDDARRTQLG